MVAIATTTGLLTYIRNAIDTQETHVTDHVLFFRSDLGVGKQFGKILLSDSIFNHHI